MRPWFEAHATYGQRVRDELSFDVHRLGDETVHRLLRQRPLEHRVELARKVAVQALVPRNQLVREGEARHQPALLEPEQRAEAAAEEDALHAREGHQALAEGR